MDQNVQTNWESALKTFVRHCNALAVLILDGATRYAWTQPSQQLPLDKAESLLKDLSANKSSFRAARLDEKACLIFLASQTDGSRAAFVYPLSCRLKTAQTEAESFLKSARLASSVSLDSLVARELPAYTHASGTQTRQAEFMSMFSDSAQADHALTVSEQADQSDTQPIQINTDSTQPVNLETKPPAPANLTNQDFWVKIV